MLKKQSLNLKKAIMLFVALSLTYTVMAQDKPAEPPKPKSDFSVGSTSFMQFDANSNSAGVNNSQFNVTRAYLTLKKDLLDYLSFRVTTDVYTSGTSLAARLKYAYMDFKPGTFLIFTKPDIEFGLAHTPWLDWEEHLNYYRLEGTMFLERNKETVSADFGATFTSLLGGEMDDNYKKTVNSKYPGKWGSIQLGVYNGAGYSALESNTNKTFQGRLSLRPLNEILPGLQLSYFNIFGQGQWVDSTKIGKKMEPVKRNPDLQVNDFMLSYEHEYFTLSGEYITGKGILDGSSIHTTIVNGDTAHATFPAANFSGYSIFGELKVLNPIKIIVRYDYYNKDKDLSGTESKRYIAGVAYDFGKNCMLLLNLDKFVPVPATGKGVEVNDIMLTGQVDF